MVSDSQASSIELPPLKDPTVPGRVTGKILVVDDDPELQVLIRAGLESDGHAVLQALDPGAGLEALNREVVDLVITDFMMPGMNGVEFLEQLRGHHPDLKCIMMTGYGDPEAVVGALREHVADFLRKPFTLTELRAAVEDALALDSTPQIEVLSACPQWIELRVPCRLSAVPILQKLLIQLKADLPAETRDEIALAFREMLNNAIEYGCKLDPSKYVTVSYVRLKRAVIYGIKDPGEGFYPAQLEHAAFGNTSDDLLHHAALREERGMRAGGFGLLITHKLVDEVIYNERRNEVIFVKYINE